jgi:hypothetical protein
VDSTVLTAIVGFVGVVLGVVATLAGPWFIEERKEKSELKKRRAEKVEELVAMLYEHQHWLTTNVRNARLFGEDHPEVISPLAKAEAIATVHFPRFLPKLAELSEATNAFEMWTLERAQARLQKGEISSAGQNEVYTPYLAKLKEVLKDIQDYAKSEFQ